MDKMKQIDHVYHAITESGIVGEICQMMIFRAKSDKEANKVLMGLCVQRSSLSVSVELSGYVLKLGGTDPIFKLVERSMDDLMDVKQGLA